jgi:hypothetical protein
MERNGRSVAEVLFELRIARVIDNDQEPPKRGRAEYRRRWDPDEEGMSRRNIRSDSQRVLRGRFTGRPAQRKQ